MESFYLQVKRWEFEACSEQSFRALSKQAVDLYEQHPAQGEALAYLMTGVWITSKGSWQDGNEKVIGGLFADLDIPAAHVEGGEAGATAKWETIKRLLDEA